MPCRPNGERVCLSLTTAAMNSRFSRGVRSLTSLRTATAALAHGTAPRTSAAASESRNRRPRTGATVVASADRHGPAGGGAMGATDAEQVSAANVEAIEAWDG